MAYKLSDKLLIDPIALLAESKKDAAMTNKPSLAGAFGSGAFPTAMGKYKTDDFGGDFSSASGLMGVEGKKALYGDQFNEIGDTVDTITMMNEADTGVYIAQAKKDQYDAMMAKQRAACKSSKKKGLIGSLITGGIGIATSNPALIASGAAGAIGSTGGC